MVGFCTQGVHSGLVGQEDNEREFSCGWWIGQWNQNTGHEGDKNEKGISSGDGFVRSCLDLLLKSPDSQCKPERVVWSKALLPKSGISPAASATWEPL